MCRNIRQLYNFEPPATDDEVRDASLQYVRKVSGFNKPSQANAEAFDRAVDTVAQATSELLGELTTSAPPKDRETVEEQGVEAMLFGVGEGHVELIAPLSPDTGVGKFIERNGPGLHHVAYATEDIDSSLAAVRDAGLRLIDEQPRRGIRNSRVAFLHPKSTGGVLTELVEPAH